MACADSPASRSRQSLPVDVLVAGVAMSRLVPGCRCAELRAVTQDAQKENTMKTEKKLELSKETLRTLDERDLSQVVGGDQSGGNTPPQGGPNSCPNTKPSGCA